ncbi:MAG: type III PLP-dependent enzyme [Kiloniellales bacterium]|nr:type III PLP-dependent enzyme [Kiloniellales bacterium]
MVANPRLMVGRSENAGRYESVEQMVADLQPREPVHCLYPRVLEGLATTFLEGFPGRVLYAVKANPDPRVLSCLMRAGIRDFDTASLAEVALVKSVDPDARCHFMAPVRLLGAAGEAFRRHGVTDFVIDHPGELEKLLAEVPAAAVTVFVRLATPSRDATYDLSTKFGADPATAGALLAAVAEAGAEAALAFNVGSLVLDPAAYREALALCAQVLAASGVTVRRIDMGGGFPSAYPGLPSAPLEDFFSAIAEARRHLSLSDEVELLGEPGRALVADGQSVVTQVTLRKEDSLYLNDGIYGNLSEPAISKGLVGFPTRTLRGPGEALSGAKRPFRLFGPTCDSLDVLPAPYDLPADIDTGDWIEFGMLGAYGLAMRTHFNGFYPETLVEIAGEPPPRMA